MSRFAVLLLLAPAGCAFFGAGQPREPLLGSAQDWRFVSGRTPTGIEYAAVVAACRDGTISGADGEPLEACLAELGLRRME